MKDVLRILLAPLVWLAGFSGVYALQGLGCALEWNQIAGAAGLSVLRIALIAAWLASCAAQLTLLLALRTSRFGSEQPFVARCSQITAVTALVAALWTLQPVIWVSSCN